MIIPDDKKEEIREAADIAEVVGDYVRLKRSGSGYVGLCPFHDEKTPSFHVTPSLGIYKCFGCGESGDVFSFVMEMEGIGFQEVLQTLADRYGISLPAIEDDRQESEFHKLKEGIYHALKFAGLYFHRQLLELDEADKAREYLEKRGYAGDIIKKFGLGYAPAGGSALLRAAKAEGIPETYLQEADLIKPGSRNSGFYDTFRGRLMFPVFNPSGKLIAFAGRVLGNEKTAKYVNSSQTPVYNKSDVVYGVNFSKNEIRKQEEAILVEGYTDVITLHKFGIRNVVASSGTSLTPGQIKILKRYGNRLTMIYDSDEAGRTAMKRGMNIALKEGMEVYLLELPQGEDPDSYVKQFGKESFDKFKQNEAEDFVSFSVHRAEESGMMEKPGDRTRVIHAVLKSISHIPEELDRQVYVQHLHQLTQKYRNNSDRELFVQLEKILRDDNPHKTRRVRDFTASGSRGNQNSGKAVAESSGQSRGQGLQMSPQKPHYEMELIRLMLLYDRPMQKYIGQNCNEKLFEDEHLRQFYKDIMQRYLEEKEATPEHYAHREDPYPRLLGDIILERHTAVERDSERRIREMKKDKDPVKTAKSAMKTLKLHHLERLRMHFSGQLKNESGSAKEKLTQMLTKTQRQITHLRRTSPDLLFPDPEEGFKSSNPFENRVFEYKMKSRDT